MTQYQLQKFVLYFQKKGYKIFGPICPIRKDEALNPILSRDKDRDSSLSLPQRTGLSNGVKKQKEYFVEEIFNPKDLRLDGKITFYPFKDFFLPSEEKLFSEKTKEVKKAIFGLTTFDLKAFILFSHIFEKDPYFQERLRNLIIIGQSLVLEKEEVFYFWEEKYEEDILEHLQFDIFLAKAGKKIKVYTGSEEGQKILNDFKYFNYKNITFAGPIKEEGLDKEMLLIKEKMEKFHNPKIWEDLGKRCIECGKCTIVCPTCFCFNLEDRLNFKQNFKERRWTSCFYNEFSKIAGEIKFLKNTSERIHFWYFHKFARIPNEYFFSGCVGCGRCIKVCPAGIDIRKVIEQIKKS